VRVFGTVWPSHHIALTGRGGPRAQFALLRASDNYNATVAINHSGAGLLGHSRIATQVEPSAEGNFYSTVGLPCSELILRATLAPSLSCHEALQRFCNLPSGMIPDGSCSLYVSRCSRHSTPTPRCPRVVRSRIKPGTAAGSYDDSLVQALRTRNV
jgi:hypothetical protein